MNHLLRLGELIKARLGLEVILEPSKASSAAHVRMLAGPMALAEIWQEGDLSCSNYSADLEVALSLRLSGGNEQLTLLHQGVAMAVRLAEMFREAFVLVGSPEDLGGGLHVDGEAIVHDARQGNAGFLQIEDDEKLFLYKEDWTVRLSTRVARCADGGAPMPPRVYFDTAHRPVDRQRGC